MTKSATYFGREKTAGFTLIEVLAATVIFTVLMGALYSVFNVSYKLRESTYAAVEAGLPSSYVTTLIKRDLTNIVAPVGLLAGAITSETEAETSSQAQLEFYTTSGVISESNPWGDIQKVEYYLAESEDSNYSYPSVSGGSDFVRATTRNLLSSVTEEPVEEPLLRGVDSLDFTYYDGDEWQESWDSTTMENEAPVAIKMRIDFIAPEADQRYSPPVEVVCEIVTQPFVEAGEDEEEGDSGP